MAVAPTEIRTLARSYTKAAIKTLVGIMRQPKAPPAARVMAANALLDRGWGKAAQLVAVDGEIRQLVEVKLNVVHASQALPGPGVIDAKHNDINSLLEDSRCSDRQRPAWRRQVIPRRVRVLPRARGGGTCGRGTLLRPPSRPTPPDNVRLKPTSYGEKAKRSVLIPRRLCGVQRIGRTTEANPPSATKPAASTTSSETSS